MNNDIHHIPVDLAQDDKFILWVNKGCPPEERVEFYGGPVNEGVIDQAILLVESLKFKEDSYSDARAETLFNKINTTIEKSSTPSIQKKP